MALGAIKKVGAQIAAGVQPAAKKQRTAEQEAAAPEESEKVVAVEATPESIELDAPPDTRPKLVEPVKFPGADSTPNVMEATHGPILHPLTQGGFQYLLAGARSNVGLHGGRYMYEMKVLEQVSVHLDAASQANAPAPRSLLRVGFSTGGASLLLGTPEDCYFDSEGFFVHDKTKTKVGDKFGRGDVVAVVLNLNTDGVNAQTVSLYKNGAISGRPQSLPETLRAKVLFPAISFRQLSLQYNFGPDPLKQLVFKCRMLQEASAKDVTVKPDAKVPKDGKFEVLFPLALPGQGGYDWLDGFLKDNPSYFEISERSLGRWAEQSGCKSQKFAPETWNSRDNPQFATGLGAIEDMSVLKVLRSLGSLMKRNWVVMSLRSNLIQSERQLKLEDWPSTFKRVAVVALGEPPDEIKQAARASVLNAKQIKLDKEFKIKQQEAKRRKDAAQKLKELQRQKKLAALEAQRKVAAAKKAAAAKKKALEAAAAKAAKATNGEEQEEEEEEEPEMVEEDEAAEMEEEPIVEEEEEAEPEEEELPDEPPKADLTEEESNLWYRPPPPVDVIQVLVDKQFTQFSVPDKSEGFDEIRFTWAKEAVARAHMKEYINSRKLVARMDDLTPGAYFTDRSSKFLKVKQTWQTKTTLYRTAQQTKAKEKAAKLAAKETKRKAKEAKKLMLEKAKALKAEVAAKAKAEKEAAREAAEGEEEKEEEMEEAEEVVVEKEEEQAAQVEEPESPDEEPEAEEEVIDFENLDVFGIEDVANIGGGRTLFTKFTLEDWFLLSLRAEFHNLLHAYAQDVKDEDRKFMHLNNVSYYYTKYYKKTLDCKNYGCENISELLAMIPDTVRVREPKMTVEPVLPDLDSFGVLGMITEECRRDRERRIDMGEQGARLKFAAPGAAIASSLERLSPAAAQTAANAAASTGVTVGALGVRVGGGAAIIAKAAAALLAKPLIAKPVLAKPATSVVPKPVGMISKPATSVIPKPATAVVAKPATAVVAKPATEVVAKPATRVVAKPATAVVAKPATAIVAKPVTAVAKPATATGSTPAVRPLAIGAAASKPANVASKPGLGAVPKPAAAKPVAAKPAAAKPAAAKPAPAKPGPLATGVRPPLIRPGGLTLWKK